jgi:hypothetical protein
MTDIVQGTVTGCGKSWSIGEVKCVLLWLGVATRQKRGGGTNRETGGHGKDAEER